MKLSAYFIFILLLIFFASCCKKERIDLPDNNNIPGLPPATQSGANTLGFLLNGKPWTPEGNNSLTIDFDSGIDDGVMGIVAYRTVNSTSQNFGFGIRDSMNFVNSPYVLSLSQNGLFRIGVYSSATCFLRSTDNGTYRNGMLKITALDRTRRIVAGSFEATLFNPFCGDTIKITNGRFDLKF
jgi:hypothetical protein